MAHTRNARGIWLAVMAALLAALIGGAAAETYPFTSVATVKVNMRRAASSSSVVLERIEAGNTVTVVGEKGNYYKVQYAGRTGYVMKEFISTDSGVMVTPAPTVEPTATGYPYDTVTTDSVNLRARASTSAQKLATIPKGAAIMVSKVSGSFAQVSYNGVEGYVKTDFILLKRIVKATATPVAATPIPTVAPWESASSYQVLQRGASGSQVTALQQALIELGFLTGSADGNFGAGTEQGVVAFQEKNSYPATGVVDANLQAFLYSGKPLNSRGVKTQIKTLAPVAGVTIRLNDQGELVTKVQTRLRELGYYTGDTTGVYDKATQTATKAFQRANSIKVDGVCGAETQQKLLGGGGLAAGATATPLPTAIPTPAPTFQIPEDTVRRGDSGAAARMVQQRLKDLGYYTGTVDGKFGSGSVAALETFQKKHGLMDDGVAGRDTYDVLFSYSALAANQLATPAPTAAPTINMTPATYPPITRENVVLIREGVSGDQVTRLQNRLTQLGYYVANANGVCKVDDVAAIKAFQEKNGLKADGVAGYDTQLKLYSQAALTYTGALTGGTVESFTTLRKGMKGEAVAAMQRRLIELGYLTGAADGKFGVQTYRALQAFQRANGLDVDGIAGAKTLARLNGGSGGSVPSLPPTTVTPGQPGSSNGISFQITASAVRYANWYSEVRGRAKQYQYATIYDFSTGISWQVHMFSFGNHAEIEPLTANDTAKMNQAFGGTTWNPKGVWVVFGDGRIYLASTHSTPHDVQHITDNNFPGHACLHFPRTQQQVTAIGPYATSHQKTIDAAWRITQDMIR